MLEKKEENKNQMTLCDFLNNNMPSESALSTIHRSNIRQRSSLPIKCTVRRRKNKSSQDSFIDSTTEFPIRGSKCQSFEKKRLYESLLYVREKEINEKTFKKIFLSELTGRTTAPFKQSMKESNGLATPTSHKFSFSGRSLVKTSKKQGYASKRARMINAETTLKEFFGNYERMKFKKIDLGIIKEIKKEVLKENQDRFGLLN